MRPRATSIYAAASYLDFFIFGKIHIIQNTHFAQYTVFIQFMRPVLQDLCISIPMDFLAFADCALVIL